MLGAPVHPDASITRSAEVIDRYIFEAEIRPEPRPETAEDVLRLLEDELPDLLMQTAHAVGQRGVEQSSEPDRAVALVLLEAVFVLTSSVRALRTGEWPRWRVSAPSAKSVRAYCALLRETDAIDPAFLLGLLEQTAGRQRTEGCGAPIGSLGDAGRD